MITKTLFIYKKKRRKNQLNLSSKFISQLAITFLKFRRVYIHVNEFAEESKQTTDLFIISLKDNSNSVNMIKVFKFS